MEYSDLKTWAELHASLGNVQARMVLELIADYERLKSGNLTETELNELCHNLQVDGQPITQELICRFKNNCEVFRRKLFGLGLSVGDKVRVGSGPTVYIIKQLSDYLALCHLPNSSEIVSFDRTILEKMP